MRKIILFPTADHDPAISAPMAEFAQIWRDMPIVVYSRTLTTAGPNATVVREIAVAAGGTVEVAATGAEGTVMKLTLPLAGSGNP